MPLTTHPETDLTAQRVVSLLEGLPRLLEKSQSLAALCQSYWLVHCAERGFLETPLVERIIQTRESILSLCSLPDKIRLCERLEKLGGKFKLSAEQVKLNHQLSQLEQAEEDELPRIAFNTSNPKNERSHLTSLSYLTSARQKLAFVSDEERGALALDNTQQLNSLEMQYYYDLIVPLYLEQIKAARRTHPDNVMRLLQNIAKFAKRLQASGVYSQAYTLYYQVFEALSTQQSFYETTCLAKIDERFLLESICALQESALTDAPPRAELTYAWSQNLSALQQLRADKKSSVEKLMPCADTLRYSPSLIEAVETLQYDITHSMKTFLVDLFKQAENLLGEPPCDYCLIALGSMARGDMTPYSDVESILLVEKNCAPGSLEILYFEILWKLITFQIQALGESYSEHPGLHIDKECHPLLPGLTTTPEKLIESYGLKAITTNDTSEGLLALTLLNSTPVHIHEKADKPETLFAQYQRGLNAVLEGEETLRQEKAREQMGRAAKVFKQQTVHHLQDGCSIKSAFLAPFAYLLGDLNLYHHLNTGHHPLILKRLVEIHCLEPTFAHACRAALAELNLLRLYQHSQTNQANDSLSSEIPRHQQERLTYLWYGILHPLYMALYSLTQTTEPAHPVFDKLNHFTDETKPPNDEQQQLILTPILHYLLYTQSPDNPYALFIDAYRRLPIAWQLFFLKRIEEVTLWPIEPRHQQETLTLLEAQANPDGWQPRMEKEKNAWETVLLRLLEPLGPGMLAEAIASQTIIVYRPSATGLGLKAYRFKPTIFAQLFNPDGTLKPKDKTQPGRHHLLPISHEGKRFWFKFTPEQPGTEFAIARLERYLGGRGTPMTQIIKVSRGKALGMAVQISEHVSGLTLEAALKEAPESVSHIDMISFTQALLRVLLTNPEDDKGDDYFLVPTDDPKRFRLMRIDNERAYYQPDTPEGFFIKSKKLDVKSALYCLNQMQQPLSPNILEAFLQIDPFALLKHWMQELKEEHAEHARLFTEDEIKDHFRHLCPGPSILGIPMDTELSEELLTRLESMQEVIRLEGIHLVKGIDLLKAVQPQLAEYYKTGFRDHPVPKSPIEPHAAAELVSNRLTMIYALYDVTPAGHRQSRLPTIKVASNTFRLKQDLTEENVIQCMRSEAWSPKQALDELHRLEGRRLEDIKKALLDETPTSIRDFRKLRMRLRRMILKGIIDEMNTTSTISTHQQTHVLKAIAGTPFHHLSLSAFHDVLTDTLLQSILVGAHKHLLVLDISRCSHLTERTFRVLAEQCSHLETLIVADIKMDDHALLLKGLIFPNLKTLIINRCEPLTHLELQAPLLERLEASACPQLDTIITGSLTLFSAHLANNPLLTEDSLKRLSEAPFRLQQLNLLHCFRISHIDFRIQFPFFGTLSLNLLSTSQVEELTKGLTQRLAKHGWNKETLPEPLKEEWVAKFAPWPIALHTCLTTVPPFLLRALHDAFRTRVITKTCETIGELIIHHPSMTPKLLPDLVSALHGYTSAWDAPETAFNSLSAFVHTHPVIAKKFLMPLLNINRDNIYFEKDISLLSDIRRLTTDDIDEDEASRLNLLAASSFSAIAHQRVQPSTSLSDSEDEDDRFEPLAASSSSAIAHRRVQPSTSLSDSEDQDDRFEAFAASSSSPIARRRVQPFMSRLTVSEDEEDNSESIEALYSRTNEHRRTQARGTRWISLDDEDDNSSNESFGSITSYVFTSPHKDVNSYEMKLMLAYLRSKDSIHRRATLSVFGKTITANPFLASQLLDPILNSLEGKGLKIGKTGAHTLGALIMADPSQAPVVIERMLKKLDRVRGSGALLFLSGGVLRKWSVRPKITALYVLDAIIKTLTIPRLLNSFDLAIKTRVSPSNDSSTPSKFTGTSLPSESTNLVAITKKRMGLFDETEMNASTQHKIQQLLIRALPATGYAIGKAISDDSACFFDAVAQALNETQVSDTLTIESLRRICAEYAKVSEREHPTTAMDPEEDAQETNWIFKARDRHSGLYQKYFHQVALTTEEAAFLEKHSETDNGLAVGGEHVIDAVIICKYFGIEIHVVELHNELLNQIDQTGFPSELHHLIDSNGVHSLKNPGHNIYQAVNTLHIIVARNHFCPILKTARLTHSYEQHRFLRPPTRSSATREQEPGTAASASPT